MSAISSPPPVRKRHISQWINQTCRHRIVDAFSPPTPPLSRASSLASSVLSPSHSPSVRDSGPARIPNRPTAEYLSPIPFLSGGPGPMPMSAAMHPVAHTRSTHSPKGSTYPPTTSYHPRSNHTHRSYLPDSSDTRAATGTTLLPTHAHTSTHTRSRSVPRAPPPITLPEDYKPLSPPSGNTNRSHRSRSQHRDDRGRSLTRSNHHTIVDDATLRPLNATRTYFGTTSPTSHHHHHTSHPTSWYNSESRHRSASQHPPVTDGFRPAYHRRRSRSYDPPPVSAPSHHSRHYEDYDRRYGTTHSGGTVARSQGSSGMDSAYHMLQASPTSPTLVHPSETQPIVVPLNDGRDGWVLIPAKGQKLRVMNPSEVRSKTSPKKSEGHSFFGKLGFGNKNKDQKHVKSSNEQVITMPAATLINDSRGHHRRHRRDSY